MPTIWGTVYLINSHWFRKKDSIFLSKIIQ